MVYKDMNLYEGKERNIAIMRYGKKAKMLLGYGVPEEYILTACKFCKDISCVTTIALLIKQWIKYAPVEIKDNIHSLTYEQWKNNLNDVIEERKVPHCFIQVGSWKVGEFDDYEDCKLFPFPNRWCICQDAKWIDVYHNKDSRLLIIYNPHLSDDFKYMVVEIEHNGLITFWDIENSSTDFQFFPEYTSILPKQIKDYLFKVSLSNNPNKIYPKIMESIKESKQINYKNMKQNTIRINESQLRKMVAESVKNVLNESSEQRFDSHIREDIATLQSIYEKWQYAIYKPEGIDEAIDAVLNAKMAFKELLHEEPEDYYHLD